MGPQFQECSDQFKEPTQFLAFALKLFRWGSGAICLHPSWRPCTVHLPQHGSQLAKGALNFLKLWLVENVMENAILYVLYCHNTILDITIRGVQIRSETDRIRDPKYSYRIDKVVS
jgi:hypothetical protein